MCSKSARQATTEKEEGLAVSPRLVAWTWPFLRKAGRVESQGVQAAPAEGIDPPHQGGWKPTSARPHGRAGMHVGRD